MTTTTTTVPPSPQAKTLRFIDRSHRDILGRPPTSAESSFWLNVLNTGYSRTTMAGNLVTSDEYRRAEVNRYYRSYLGRSAPAAEQAFYAGLIANEGWLFEWVAMAILGGDEFYARSGSTPAGYVTQLLSQVLGVAPDLAIVDFWVGQILGGLDRYSVALAFVTYSVTRQNMVAEAYSTLLDRAGTQAEIDFWVGHVNAGMRSEYIPAFLVGSEEYWART